MKHPSFPLKMTSLQALGSWAADCAEQVLAIYEAHPAADDRPRAALTALRHFAAGGKRTAQLRTLAWAAHAAAREIKDPAAAAAARAASLAAASAYTHALADVQQTKHIVGPVAQAALALELQCPTDSSVAATAIRSAIAQAPPEVYEILLQMPARAPGKSRLDQLMYTLDAGLRAQASRKNQAGQLLEQQHPIAHTSTSTCENP
jgi:hypothetical protein